MNRRLKDVQSLEELGDVYNHFLLYYGRDIPKMQNAAKASKKRLKKIKEVSEDGKMDVSESTVSYTNDGYLLQRSGSHYFNNTRLVLMGFLHRGGRGAGGGRRRGTERTRPQAGVS